MKVSHNADSFFNIEKSLCGACYIDCICLYESISLVSPPAYI